jgi:hypothetical protein
MPYESGLSDGRQYAVHTHVHNDECVYLCTGRWPQALITYQKLLTVIISEEGAEEQMSFFAQKAYAN